MNRVRRHIFENALLAGVCGLLLIGCDQSGPPELSGVGDSAKAALPDTVFLAEAPPDPTPIPQLKKTANEGDEVVVRVVIGGRERPFVDNRAIMTVVEGTMPNQCISPDDSCETPWDYCCEAPEALKENLASVRINDAQGLPLKVDLTDSPRLKPLATLVVRGTVGPRPDAETLVVNASGIYVEATP